MTNLQVKYIRPLRDTNVKDFSKFTTELLEGLFRIGNNNKNTESLDNFVLVESQFQGIWNAIITFQDLEDNLLYQCTINVDGNDNPSVSTNAVINEVVREQRTVYSYCQLDQKYYENYV